MIGLVLIACHMVGDYLLQTRWQAERKITDPAVRARHVLTYALPFVPVAAWRTWGGAWSSWHAQRGVVFLVALVVLHFWTDSRRFRSSLGDWIAWYVGGAGPPAEKIGVNLEMGNDISRLPPNPWVPLPILLDQSLHMVQLAVLGWLLT